MQQTSANPEERERQAFEEHPLSKKDQKLQAELQRKVDAYDKAEGVHHLASGPLAHPPKVVITGPRHGGLEAAEYDHDGTIYVSQAQAHDRKTIDFALAHEVAHQKDGFNGDQEKKADVEAARIVGPQTAIDSIHRQHKTNPEQDDVRLAEQDIFHHGTTIEREQNIQKNFPDQKLRMPKHHAPQQPAEKEKGAVKGNKEIGRNENESDTQARLHDIGRSLKVAGVSGGLTAEAAGMAFFGVRQRGIGRERAE